MRAAVSPDADVSIRLCGVGKSYKVYDQPFNFLREVLTGRSHHREKEVLRDISFEMRDKEIVGIIGRNGAGKSTLLKIIAGTLSPSVGTLEVSGRVSAILELGTGFNPAFTGRENVLLSALMRGMSEAEVRAKLDDIVAFAGLESVIDEPFHTYSSGMQGRLAFAAAVSVEADIIIIDEALSTGDARFAARSLRRIHEICQSGVTALFVSHNTYQVMQLCTRAIWIDDGRIRMDGPPLEVVRAYEYEMHEAIARDQGRMAPRRSIENTPAEPAGSLPPEVESSNVGIVPPGPTSAFSDAEGASASSMPTLAHEQPPERASDGRQVTAVKPARTAFDAVVDFEAIETVAKPHQFTTGAYRILETAFLTQDGRETRIFRFGEPLRFRVSYECLLAELPEHSCGLAVAFNRVSDFEAVMYFNTNYAHSDQELLHYHDKPFRRFVGRHGIIEAVIDPLQLKSGEYFVSFGILPNRFDTHDFYEYRHCHDRISVLPNGFDEPSVFYPMVTWKHGDGEPTV